MSDEITEAAEHQEFMDAIYALERQIFLAYMQMPADVLTNSWNDIRTFGDEPVFTNMIFDQLERERGL